MCDIDMDQIEYETQCRIEAIRACSHKISELSERNKQLEELLSRILRDGLLAVHSHWDETMRHGEGCPICIVQRTLKSEIYKVLDDPQTKGKL